MSEVAFVILFVIAVAVVVRAFQKLLALFQPSGAGRYAEHYGRSVRNDVDGWFAPTAAPSKPKWLGRGDLLQVKGFEIAHPLTYVTSAGGAAIDPSEIDRTLPVVQTHEPQELQYWPWYARMDPAQRYAYLEWLSSDRATLPPGDGYLFVYYYGLERRALVDDTDHATVFAEVQRLRQVYDKHSPKRGRSSFMDYSSALLWFLAAYKPDQVKLQRVHRLAELTRAWREEKTAAALAWCVTRNQALPPWLAFPIAEQSPQSQRSVVTRRVGDEFRELFTKRYQEQFGDGMKLRVSKRQRCVSYHPASAVIDHASFVVPNVLGIQSQFKKLSTIWNGCIDDLRKLSSVTKGQTDAALTADAWEAMPSELRQSVEHPQNDAVCDLVASHTDGDGHVFVEARELAGAMQMQKRDRLTASQSRRIATIVEHIGFAVEPDPRLNGRSYRADTLLAVFPQAYEGEPDFRRYGGAACMMRLGLAVAEADGRIDDEELQRVRNQIEEGFELNDHERRRLEALQTLLLKTGSDITGLGKRLQEVVGESGRQSIGRLLVAVAACDGVITKGELRALRKCFRLLGLSSAVLDATFQELAPDAAEAPVTVSRGRRRGVGERIPGPGARDVEVNLDREAVARIMHETRAVSALLAEAMDIPTDERAGATVATLEPEIEQRTASTRPETIMVDAGVVSEALHPTPPARFAAFYAELVAKPRWPREEAERLARKLGHMLSGALESINEWAFEELGAQLVYDDGDELEVDLEVLEGSN